jgi:tRNA wybutosine-synthesizing protein 4
MTIDPSDSRLISSFGAQIVQLGPHAMICGGMGADACLNGQTLTIITPSAEGLEVKDFSTPGNSERMPFMIGSSIVQDGDSLLVIGGGATCFSMGTFWDTGVYRIRLPDAILDAIHSASRLNSPAGSSINLVGSRKFVAASATTGSDVPDNLNQESRRVSLTYVPTIQLESAEQFRTIVREGKPVILRGCNIGQCQQKWTPEYLVSQIGADEKVSSIVTPT